MKSQKSSGKLKKLKRLPMTVRQVSGHSMMPVLPPGTLILGLKWFRGVRPGDIIIFTHNDKEKIKRVSEVEGDRIYVLGDHAEASHDSRHFGWLDAEDILAKVVWPHAPRHRAEGIEPHQ